ncbi:MAG TPA: hypothetical protein VKR59_05265 [Terriglobales bacterium]|nr:hypothetical protein [Terriglobales bacterium]
MTTQRVFELVVATLAASALCLGQTQIEVQEVKELKPTGSLSTCGYKATEREAPFFQKLPSSETATGSFTDKHEYQIRGKIKHYVSWFGVVRLSSRGKGDDRGRDLVIQQLYFDGMTDCHIMLVSNSGAGDFVAKITSSDTVPLLSLVRVYGTVVKEENGVPQLSVDYVRVWPWFTFTLTDLGPRDHSNPEWSKYCKICKGDRVYNPYPTEDYYRGMLGDPKDFVPKSEAAH